MPNKNLNSIEINYQETVQWWQQKNIQTDAELAEALNGHSIAFAYHSGKIENDQITYHDTREVFEHNGVTAYTGDLRTLFEISNAKDASELLLTVFKEKHPIDESLVKKFQRTLAQKTYDTRRWQLGERPGEYKQHDFVTGKNEIGALPEDVPGEMQELLDELREIPVDQVLTAAAYFHAKFENIHPFSDANGRSGRLLTNYFLLIHNYPPIIIHEEDRKAYYEALESWDTGQELEPLIVFLKAQTVKTWKKQLQRRKKN